VNVKETHFKKIRQACRHTQLNFNDIVYFKSKLQLKFRNKNYSFVIVNFHTGLR
jgi:hypothetical protein